MRLICVILASLLAAVTAPARDIASWYGEDHRGKIMTNGQPFDPDKLTAASWFFDLGTKVLVEYHGRKVIVEITDRGPNLRLVRQGRKIDLARAAFGKLEGLPVGLIDVKISMIK